MFYFERRELKFYVSFDKLSALRKSIIPFMKHDEYCCERSDRQYIVRSIYFDTHDYEFYQEKLMGIKCRKKLRVRVYNYPSECKYAFLEIKNKREDIIRKERARIPLEHVSYFAEDPSLLLNDNKGVSNGGKAIDKFLYFLYRKNLEPVVLVTYEREAFHGIDNPSVRVTFDMNVRSHGYTGFDDIFRDRDLVTVNSDSFVLEVKTYGNLPIWIRNIIRDYDLKLQSISKYCEGVDAGRKLFA